MCLHFWHIYHLSPSYILIAPERITVPLRVRRTPRCFTRTLPMRGKVSNQMQTHSHTNQTNNYPSKELKQNQYRREKNRKKKNQGIRVGNRWCLHEHEWISSQPHFCDLSISNPPIQFSTYTKQNTAKSKKWSFL